MTNKINLKKGVVEVNALTFKEGEYFIAFIPALNLTSHSKDERKALKEIKNAIQMFFDYWIGKDQLDVKLSSLGWKPSLEDKRFKPSTDNIRVPLSLLNKNPSSRLLQIPAY